jgi:hypothetical protein
VGILVLKVIGSFETLLPIEWILLMDQTNQMASQRAFPAGILLINGNSCMQSYDDTLIGTSPTPNPTSKPWTGRHLRFLAPALSSSRHHCGATERRSDGHPRASVFPGLWRRRFDCGPAPAICKSLFTREGGVWGQGAGVAVAVCADGEVQQRGESITDE